MAGNTRTMTATDPVCGMAVDPSTAKHRSEYRGETFSFCSLMCKKAFEDDPLHYLNRPRPPAAAPAGR